MAYPSFIDEVVNATTDELGDAATVSDGSTAVAGVPGFFRREWDQELSDVYGLSMEAATWECRLDALPGINLGAAGSTLTVLFEGRTYVAQDARRDSHVNVLLILSR